MKIEKTADGIVLKLTEAVEVRGEVEFELEYQDKAGFGLEPGLECQENAVYGLEYQDENGEWLPAGARLDGAGQIVLRLDARQVETVKAVRFAWNDCPLDANLYSKAGLPLVPFCIQLEKLN